MDLLLTAISNLITNAIKHSKSEKIDVILKKSDKDIEIVVQDYGTGINEENLNHIFEKFYRGDNTLKGTGLGLAIVKNIVELHNGKITVQSEEGKGTSFKIIIN